MKGHVRRDPGEVALLAEILEGTANLSGAECVSSPGLFDARQPDEEPDDVEYRHAAAVRLCHRCPVLEECQAWADSRSDQEHAVTAGRMPRRPGRPKGGRAA